MRTLALALLLLLAGNLCATTAAKLDLDALTTNSTVVARGKITAKEARWDKDNAAIWTHHTVEVSDVARGDKVKTLEFVTRGGVVGKVGQAVRGSGSFEIGDEHVLFLARDSEKRLQLVGMVQGAFKLSQREGKTYAKNSYSGLALVDGKTLQALSKEASSPLEFEIGDLLKRVRDKDKTEREASASGTKDPKTAKTDDPGPATQDPRPVAPEQSK